MRTCDIEGCTLRHEAKGLCRRHYSSWRYKTDIAVRERVKKHASQDYRDNRDKRLAKSLVYGKDYYQRLMQDPVRREQRRKKDRDFNTRRRPYLAAQEANRRAQKIKATPKWADLVKIRQIYERCPAGMHVDHIVPLRGKNVCGLHVEYNLQVLPASDNCRKNNKWPL